MEGVPAAQPARSQHGATERTGAMTYAGIAAIAVVHETDSSNLSAVLSAGPLREPPTVGSGRIRGHILEPNQWNQARYRS
jgi:hypothetical protein